MNRKIFVLTGLFCAAFCSQVFCSDSFTVVLPVNATVQEETAASELLFHLKKYSSAAVVREGAERLERNLRLIYLGNGKHTDRIGWSAAEMSPEEWRIKALSDRELVIAGGIPRGVIYGAYEFLERFAGVMWLDEFTTFIPERKIRWAPDLYLTGQPSFQWRSVYTYYNDFSDNRTAFACRSRQNFFLNAGLSQEMRRRGLTPLFGRPRACHSYYDYTRQWERNVPEEYFSYSATEKKRLRATSPLGPGQVCLSHPEVRKRFAASLRDYILQDRQQATSPKDWPVLYDISANDNYSPCACPKCLANLKKFGNYAGLTVDFINEIARSVRKDFPEVRIQTFAYYFSQEPPPEETKIEDNVIIRLAQMGTEFNGDRVQRDSMRPLGAATNLAAARELKKWSALARMSLWEYWIVFMGRGELTENASVIAENLRLDHGRTDIVFAECERPMEVCFHALRVWLGRRLMNNVNLNAQQETTRFLQAYYGLAAGEMTALLELVRRENRSELLPLSIPVSCRRGLDGAFFRKAEKLLIEAEKKAGGDRELLLKIYREQIAFDRARLAHWRLATEELPDRTETGRRLMRNFKLLAGRYFMKKRIAGEEQNLQRFINRQPADCRPHPEFPGRKVLAHYAGTALDAPKSRMLQDPDYPGIWADTLGPKIKHRKAMTAGFYDVMQKKTISFSQVFRNIPTDEKYHWYRLGTVTPSMKCYIYFHSSWRMQKQLDELFGFCPGKSMEIHCRIRFTGPVYVPESQKQNAVRLAEVLILEGAHHEIPPGPSR